MTSGTTPQEAVRAGLDTSTTASERKLILDAAYALLRERRKSFTVDAVLSRAGVSTRALYRHFRSKDDLLAAIYLRDANSTSRRLTGRVTVADSPTDGVLAWIREIYSMAIDERRAERIAVLATIDPHRSEQLREAVRVGRQLLTTALRAAVAAGVEAGDFTVTDANAAADLAAAATFYGADLVAPRRGQMIPLEETTSFCMRALGARAADDGRSAGT